jgi:hypothetical protein
MGLLEYQAACLPYVGHLRCFVYIYKYVYISPRSGQVVLSVREDGMDRPLRTKVQNHTLLGHSPPASQAVRRVGPAL